MILPKSEDAIHKAWLYRLLSAILDDLDLSGQIYFKGGTCAAMLGFLDRFSIDLDFDVNIKADKKMINRKLLMIFNRLDLKLKQKSSKTMFYLLKYQSALELRNTLKLSLIDLEIKTNIYQTLYLSEINRYAKCQTKETMFANKLVAITDRYYKNKTIAGRDLYDVHYFFIQGYQYHKPIIKERTGIEPEKYLKKLINFIDREYTNRIISQDLNFLLPEKKFKIIRKVLKKETLMFLKDELKRFDK